MWPFLVVVSTPNLQLFGRVCKCQEPVRVQAFRAEPAIEGFDKGVVRRLSRAREVERDATQIGPEVHVAGDELAALIHSDRLGISSLPTGSIQCRDHVFTAVAEPRIVSGVPIARLTDGSMAAGQQPDFACGRG